MDELHADDYLGISQGQTRVGRPELDEIKMASLEDLRALRESLSFLKTQIIQFNELNDDGGFRDELARIPS